MTTASNKDHLYLSLAFELAYFIHVSKEVAFFVAEDALEELPLMLGNQEKNRKPSDRMSGFWKWGERSRPIRQTVRLSESQMLQWLVYKQSESWERKSEAGSGLYLPTEDDMVLRYLEHLVFLTLRRGSFYVTLAIGQLLHQFDRRETRLLYDILTQSDSARMKDLSYIGKQRLELLGRICQRFDHMVHTVKIPGREKQLVMRPTTGSATSLVLECLRRFTPWDTACVLRTGFDVTDIPGFYFQAESVDEDPIEMDRIHTLVDPTCFARFVEGLRKYARQLPDDNQDKGCSYDSLSEQLMVPEFFNFPGGSSRGDRFEPPTLTPADYVRLDRTLDARARRRRTFAPQHVSVYVDNVLTESFDAKRRNRVQFQIGPEAGVIEVRGCDDLGTLTLAILLVEFDQLQVGGAFRDSTVGQGGQKVQIQMTPVWNGEEAQGALVRVDYSNLHSLQRVAEPMHRAMVALSSLLPSYSGVLIGSERKDAFLLKAGAAIAVLALVILTWFTLRRPQPAITTPEQAGQPTIEEQKPDLPSIPSKAPEQPKSATKVAPLIARATWSIDPQAALRAIPVEPTRSEVKRVDGSGKQQELLVSLPVYDDGGRTYSRYRITLAEPAKSVWQQTLRAPKVSLTGHTHILDLALVTQRLAKGIQYELGVEGWTRNSWQQIGHLFVSQAEK
jgi:hypothetical protein